MKVLRLRNFLLSFTSLVVVFASWTMPTAVAQDAATWSATIAPAKGKAGDLLTISAKAKLTSGWHIYSVTPASEGPVPTSFSVPKKGPLMIVGKPSQPAPISKYDENFGVTTEYFEKDVTFTLTVKIKPGTPEGPVKTSLLVSFMGCNDRMCLPSKTVSVPLSITVLPGGEKEEKGVMAADTTARDTVAPPSASAPAVQSSAPPSGYGDEGDVKKAKAEGFWAYIGLAMSVGALALLTPCVFPMIPITVSFFTKRKSVSRARSVRDASIYSLGIIFTFTGLGILLAVIFGASGINQLAANPWINILIAAVFIGFALNLFGLFEIVVPSGLLTKLTKASGEGDSILSLILMGLTFTLTSFTCTVPFVGTVMVAAASGDIWWSILGMLAFSSVFALPFFLLALFPTWLKSLPKSGGWLNSVKVVMGFLELAAAMKFMSNVDLIWGLGILSRDFFLSLWVGIGVITTGYLLGKITLPHDSPVERIGVFRMLFSMFFVGISIYLSTGLGSKALGELDAFLPPVHYASAIEAAGGSAQSSTSGASEEQPWMSDYAAALKKAQAEGKPIFVDFTGFACTNCRWMEANVFPRQDVRALLDKYILVRLYTDGQGEMYLRNRDTQEKRFGTVALPLYVIMDSQDKEISRFPGLTRKPEEFLSFLKKGLDVFSATPRQNS